MLFSSVIVEQNDAEAAGMIRFTKWISKNSFILWQHGAEKLRSIQWLKREADRFNACFPDRYACVVQHPDNKNLRALYVNPVGAVEKWLDWSDGDPDE